MTPSAVAASTMGSAAAMRSAAVEPASTAHLTAMEASTDAASRESVATVSAATFKSAAVVSTSVEPAAVVSVAPSAVIPRSGADKCAIQKPVWPIVSIRRTCVRRIRVIAVVANRRSISWPYPDSDPNSHLRLRERQRHHQRGQHRYIFQVFHGQPLSRIRRSAYRNPEILSPSATFIPY